MLAVAPQVLILTVAPVAGARAILLGLLTLVAVAVVGTVKLAKQAAPVS
jgi:hypothetical protein